MGSGGAWTAARRLGILKEILPSAYRKWDEETVKSEALKYKSRLEFAHGSAAAYDAATRKGWLDRVCAHMEATRKKWDEDAVRLGSTMYETRKAFAVGNGSAYKAARRLGILDELFPVDKSVKG